MIYIVLGMHKSGTTLISKTLHESGINMGDFDMSISYDKGNQYERKEVLDLNIEILNAESMPSYSIKKPDFLEVTENQKKIAKNIILDNSKRYINWGFKEPRTSFTFSFWKAQLINFEHKVIVVYRDPLELLVHFKVKNPKYFFLVIDSWMESNESILHNIKEYNREEVLLLNYNKLILEQSEFDKLCEFLPTSCVDLRNKSLYRSKKKYIPSHILFLYNIFYRKKVNKIINKLQLLDLS